LLVQKILVRLGGLLILLVILLLGGRYFYLQNSLPKIDGELRRIDGSPYAVKASNVRTNQPRPFETRNGPSFRAIYDLSDLDNSRYLIPTGQSGNPASPYYDQLTDLWAAGYYIRIPTEPDEIAKITQARRRLRPTQDL
jgi:acyl-homoserine lactone acylase PvdQ